MKTLRHIVIVDHQPLYRKALADLLVAINPQADVRETNNATQAYQCLQQHTAVDLVILELARNDKRAIEVLQFLREQRPKVQIIATADHELPSHWQEMVERGLNGFIPKTTSVEQIKNALRAIAEGKRWFPSCVDSSEEVADCGTLTPQQSRILSLLRRGLLNKQIADQLSISEATVRTHMTAIFKKLGVNNRTQAVVVSQKRANQKHAGENLAASA